MPGVILLIINLVFLLDYRLVNSISDLILRESLHLLYTVINVLLCRLLEKWSNLVHVLLLNYLRLHITLQINLLVRLLVLSLLSWL